MALRCAPIKMAGGGKSGDTRKGEAGHTLNIDEFGFSWGEREGILKA